ncbi:hypothetical protein [Niveibacterium microcysteis]|uniref:FAD-binding oxidoreductase n=1 Tax=Niveibacterium microcysteis TaxID=2811415 RepID=A0ABX7MCG0_9RHOO|nr:hypothetical protein [Niveibacterium microcysteis]QSI78379.1 hypothetical protein JY500_07070 [Niveibacterium microcysteis]
MKRHNRPGWRHLAQSVFVLCGLAASVAWADTLKPFTTDGCSSFPDGTPWQQTLWLDCCVKHDIAYWIGGTKEDRVAADETLEQCVAAVAEPAIAKLMLAGVRAGGTPYFPTTYRWGYGWSYPRGYGALSRDDAEQVNARRLVVPMLNGAGVKAIPALHKLLGSYDLLAPAER